MALINTLRNKMGKVVVVVISAAILSFILTDLLGPNSTILGNNSRNVGEIAGEDIPIDLYQAKIQQLERRYGGQITENQRHSIRQTAWDGLISDIAFGKEFQKLGIEVSDDELFDMVQGKNMSAGIIQSFSDPQTGEFNKDQLVAYLNYLANLSVDHPDRVNWSQFENDLRTGRRRLKYDNLLVLSNYVTNDEAKLNYVDQTAVAEIKYLYVPFYTVNDSAINVTDNALKTYLNNHKADFNVDESRSLSYVNFPIVPSATDTADFNAEIEQLKIDFANATNDSLYARINTDGGISYSRHHIGNLPPNLEGIASNLTIGAIWGPYPDNAGRYKIFKISDIYEDTVYSANVRHILFRADDDTEESKNEARAEARKILREIKNGADFAEMAREHGTDGTASRGGDLGWGTEGQSWVPKFEEPIFKANKAGLVNDVVETEYGFHIIDIVEPKTNVGYKIATIERELIPSDETRNDIYRKAEFFAYNAKDYDTFITTAEKDTLQVNTADKLGKNDRRINDLSNARAVVQWLYRDASMKKVSEVFELDNNYVIAVMTGETEEGTADVDDVRDQLTVKVENDLKGDFIVEKLQGLEGSLDDIASAYGSDANVYTSSDLKFNTNSLPTVGYSPEAVGRAFGLKAGERSAAFKTDNGVLIIEMVNFTDAPEIADYTTYKDQLIQAKKSRVSFSIMEAIKEFSDIEDERYRFQ
ncbi:SurA N-terminal domain-containing protein [Fulvivirgaceae bacterium BMA10]|uniref:Periplasmic chaperone PpiD n=1 Tax=Splendidivirga corallicola TaxID=3051826 RepID=A0ABT8KVN8_9BACT|nr:SurA N-terminal domain-containing protein [Fulvivirgaceae bacterium BMA10]